MYDYINVFVLFLQPRLSSRVLMRYLKSVLLVPNSGVSTFPVTVYQATSRLIVAHGKHHSVSDVDDDGDEKSDISRSEASLARLSFIIAVAHLLFTIHFHSTTLSRR